MASRTGGGYEWKSRYESLDRSHQDLRTQLSLQERVTSEVRQEAAGFLVQMKALSENGGHSAEREEQLVRRVHQVENDVKDWKNRYARAKTQAGSFQAGSISHSISKSNVGAIARDYITRDGLIKDIHVTQFHIAIDELLRSAREHEAQSVLAHVKAVAIAVRSITLDVGDTRLNTDEMGAQQQRYSAKVSATANNLITAAKNFAMSHGLSPVSLLDAAASHLAASVIELVKTVKMCSTPADEIGNGDEHGIHADSPADYYGVMRHGRGSEGDGSIYSALSSPRPARSFAPTGQGNGAKSTPNGTSNGIQCIESRLAQGLHDSPREAKLRDLKVCSVHHPDTCFADRSD